MRGISRIEGPEGRGSGWMVRLTRGGKTSHKWFADGVHGGKLKAAKAARAYHRELEASAPPAGTTRGVRTARNTSGKVGVRLERKVTSRGERRYQYESYVAYWRTPRGENRTITFSCSKYGRRAAFKLASIARDHENADRAWVEQKHRKARG